MTIATEAASSSSAASVIILAAGVGRRLGLSQADACLPKVLLEFGGRSLLARHISILRKCGMSNITVVAGYRAQLLRAEIARIEGGSTVSIIENFDYQEGSVVSLWTAREILRSVSRVILMDGDVLYDERLMARLVSTRLKNCLLLDRNIEPGDEPVKICVAHGRIVDFDKRPRVAHEWYGESVGFFHFAPDSAAELATRAEAYVTQGRRDMEYEELIRDMILASGPRDFGFEDISGLPWIEIDFLEDAEKARSAVLPSLIA
jgi:choline kinase